MPARIILLFLAAALILAAGCDGKAQEKAEQGEREPGRTPAQITFIELGSVKCIPCRAMQPVMHAIQEKFGTQIEIIFYDVWQPDQRHYGQQYHIRLIPTQVFLDDNGIEILRHEGFFPEQEITEFLVAQGLTPIGDR
ncbi:MAG: thioredoxin family protein [Fidelibacterota bacterium]|nr:MAG: thioredoxin family protein [Candidatus Neomarinimicrobiota bacterium]